MNVELCPGVGVLLTCIGFVPSVQAFIVDRCFPGRKIVYLARKSDPIYILKGLESVDTRWFS